VGCELKVTEYCVIRYPRKRETGWPLHGRLDDLFHVSLPDKGRGILLFLASIPASVQPPSRGCNAMFPCG
jgi:hypothetical protein